MNPRLKAIELNTERSYTKRTGDTNPNFSPSENFGIHVFNRGVMQKMLPREIYKNILDAMAGKEGLKPEYADTIAVAMKEWATQHGATHYSHWFQPLTGTSAEKHDSFIDWNSSDEVIEKFTGKQLIQGEPDASSFPSGGLRSTYEARGYTGWDPTSPVFLWRGGDGVTLTIPSFFFSWTGDVLDAKIPLLRSDKSINTAVMRLLKLTGIQAERVYSTLGLEQEYFVVDRALRNLRPDLILLGKTVFGAQPPKGQELQDHYFASVKDRLLCYMRDFEEAAWQLAIPVKTRHNEVAPAQHEVAPVFEKSPSAIDHNLLLMELMRQTASKHNLSCLLHEKPFHNFNGSGKHSNWSLSTDSGINLLDPSDAPENNMHFLILLVAIVEAIHEHAGLLRATIGSASNDNRLGGHEAPPAIISVYLGQELESLLEDIEKHGERSKKSSNEKYNLGLLEAPEFTKDNTDRNRTSPFAFTGNKFEFRAVGSSSNPSFSITALNVVVADSLNKILDEIEKGLPARHTKKELADVIIPVLRKHIKASKPVRFSGDNYSEAWVKEAEKRGLPNIKSSIYAFEALKSDKTISVFEGILNKHELISRYEVAIENYSNALNIEARLMLDMWQTQIFPAAIKYQQNIASSIAIVASVSGSEKLPQQTKLLHKLSKSIEKATKAAEELDKERSEAEGLALVPKAKAYCENVLPKCEALREVVDYLETIVDDDLWPLPKYRELLFVV